MLFLIGAVFGLRHGDRPADARLLACAIAANAIVGIGLPVIAYLLYPAWMWGYLVDPEHVSPLIVIGIFLLYWVPFVLGLRTHSWKVVVGGALAQVAFIAWQWPAYSTVTTLEGFRAGVKVPPAEVPLLTWGGPVALLIVGILLFLARPITRQTAQE
ncbi:MAG: hypothetical protein HYY16_06935 [Planctomycetes bacterium]|nr:hypothetical protein [Planctomycetota bacterium]